MSIQTWGGGKGSTHCGQWDLQLEQAQPYTNPADQAGGRKGKVGARVDQDPVFACALLDQNNCDAGLVALQRPDRVEADAVACKTFEKAGRKLISAYGADHMHIDQTLTVALVGISRTAEAGASHGLICSFAAKSNIKGR